MKRKILLILTISLICSLCTAQNNTNLVDKTRLNTTSVDTSIKTMKYSIYISPLTFLEEKSLIGSNIKLNNTLWLKQAFSFLSRRKTPNNEPRGFEVRLEIKKIIPINYVKQQQYFSSEIRYRKNITNEYFANLGSVYNDSFSIYSHNHKVISINVKYGIQYFKGNFFIDWYIGPGIKVKNFYDSWVPGALNSSSNTLTSHIHAWKIRPNLTTGFDIGIAF